VVTPSEESLININKNTGDHSLHHKGVITLMMDAVSSSETSVNIYQKPGEDKSP
jgi:hypothetical protein